MNEVQRLAIDFDKSFALLAVGDGCSCKVVSILRLCVAVSSQLWGFVPVFFLPKHCTI